MTLGNLAGKALRKIGAIPPKYQAPKSDGNGRFLIQGSWMYVDDKDSLNLTKYGIYEPDSTAFIKKLVKPEFEVQTLAQISAISR